jgi:hypothetical protein
MLPGQSAGRRYYLFADCGFAESVKDVTDVTSGEQKKGARSRKNRPRNL